MVSPRRLSELIQLLYASVEDPAVWSRFLEGLAEEVGAGMTLLLAAPRKGGSVGISTAVRADPESLRAYAEEGWSERDLFATSGHPSVTQEGAVVITEEIVPSRDLVHTDFYNEFMRRFDMFHSVVATLLSDDRTSAGLAFHFSRSARLPDADLEQAEHAAAEALEHATTGFVFLDGRGTILRANGRAEEVLRAGDGVFSRGGRLAARLPDDDRALQRAICGACSACSAGPRPRRRSRARWRRARGCATSPSGAASASRPCARSSRASSARRGCRARRRWPGCWPTRPTRCARGAPERRLRIARSPGFRPIFPR